MNYSLKISSKQDGDEVRGEGKIPFDMFVADRCDPSAEAWVGGPNFGEELLP